MVRGEERASDGTGSVRIFPLNVNRNLHVREKILVAVGGALVKNSCSVGVATAALLAWLSGRALSPPGLVWNTGHLRFRRKEDFCGSGSDRTRNMSGSSSLNG